MYGRTGEIKMDFKENKENRKVGLGFIDALTLIFITLKLIGIIDWSWWWILSPIWIYLLVAIIIAIILVIVSEIFNRR